MTLVIWCGFALGDWQGATAEGYWSDKAGIAQIIMKHLGGHSTDYIMSATKAIKVFQRCCGQMTMMPLAI